MKKAKVYLFIAILFVSCAVETSNVGRPLYLLRIALAQNPSVECLVRKYDSGGGRKSGDIISIKQSPCVWGTSEGLPEYIIIKIDNVNLSNVSSYHVRHRDNVRSRYRFNLSQLTGYTDNTAMLTISLSDFQNNIIDRRTE